MVEIELGVKGLIRLILFCFLTGALVGTLMYTHWIAFFTYVPFWIIPIWVYFIPIIGASVYFLIISR